MCIRHVGIVLLLLSIAAQSAHAQPIGVSPAELQMVSMGNAELFIFSQADSAVSLYVKDSSGILALSAPQVIGPKEKVIVNITAPNVSSDVNASIAVYFEEGSLVKQGFMVPVRIQPRNNPPKMVARSGEGALRSGSRIASQSGSSGSVPSWLRFSHWAVIAAIITATVVIYRRIGSGDEVPL